MIKLFLAKKILPPAALMLILTPLFFQSAANKRAPTLESVLDDPEVLPLLIDFPSGHEDMNVPCRDGRFLYDFIRRKNYRRGLEIGTFTGYSALWFGLAFKETGGRLITIEIDQKPGEEARRNFQKAGLEDVIDSRIADAFEEIQMIEGRFDFIFIDAWKPDYMRFLKLLRDRVAPGGAIIAHNVTNYARLAEPIELKVNHFTGRLLILIDGGGASTTGHLCGLLKYHKLGTLIGEETGATYVCHDGHENLNLKHTRLQVSVATGTYAAAVQGLPNDRGIIPDIPVLPKPEDMACGRDTVLEYAMGLCR